MNLEMVSHSVLTSGNSIISSWYLVMCSTLCNISISTGLFRYNFEVFFGNKSQAEIEKVILEVKSVIMDFLYNTSSNYAVGRIF